MLARHLLFCVLAFVKSGCALSQPAGWRLPSQGVESLLASGVAVVPGAAVISPCWPPGTSFAAPALTAVCELVITVRRCCRSATLIGRGVSVWPKKLYLPETRRGAGLLAKGRRSALPARSCMGRATSAGESLGVGPSRQDPGQQFPVVTIFAEGFRCGGDISSFIFSARELHCQIVASDIASFNFSATERQLVASDIASFNFLARELQLIEELEFDDMVRRPAAAAAKGWAKPKEVKRARG